MFTPQKMTATIAPVETTAATSSTSASSSASGVETLVHEDSEGSAAGVPREQPSSAESQPRSQAIREQVSIVHPKIA